MDEPNLSSIQAYKFKRRKFTIIVYVLFTVMVLVSIVQWLPLLMSPLARDFFCDQIYFSIVAFGLVTTFTIVFVFVENIRFTPCLNFFMTFLIMQLIIIGAMGALVRAAVSDVVFAITIAALVCIIVLLVASVIAHDLTLDVVILFIIAFILFVGSGFFVLWFVLTDSHVGFVIYAILLTINLLMFLMYHAQTIQGGRYAEMRVQDYYLAALILYADYVLLLLVGCYVVKNTSKAIENAKKEAHRKMTTTARTTTTTETPA